MYQGDLEIPSFTAPARTDAGRQAPGRGRATNRPPAHGGHATLTLSQVGQDVSFELVSRANGRLLVGGPLPAGDDPLGVGSRVQALCGRNTHLVVEQQETRFVVRLKDEDGTPLAQSKALPDERIAQAICKLIGIEAKRAELRLAAGAVTVAESAQA